MTIYILSQDHAETAKWLDDKSLDRQIKDIAQGLCNVHYMFWPEKITKDIPLKHCFTKRKIYLHEWSQWARECKANYLWLVELLSILLKEILDRNIGYKGNYFSIYLFLRDNVPNLSYFFETETTKEYYHFESNDGSIKKSNCTNLPLIMPKKYRLEFIEGMDSISHRIYGDEATIESYRNYYHAKLNMKYKCSHPFDNKNINWTRRELPLWLKLREV